jgi:hypothetical protein
MTLSFAVHTIMPFTYTLLRIMDFYRTCLCAIQTRSGDDATSPRLSYALLVRSSRTCARHRGRPQC